MSYSSLLICFGAVALGLSYIIYQFVKINKLPVSDPKVTQLQSYIKEGSMTFLKREYSVIALFVIALAILIATFLGAEHEAGVFFAGSAFATAVSFLVGAIFAMVGGFVGMRAATLANGCTAQAAKDKGLEAALKTAFSGGSIAGLILACLGLFGLSGLILFFTEVIYSADQISLVVSIVTGFSLGASFVALFARVGGGIYTKIADVGADLVGKVEAGIPEDDPRNPAVLADNVGDNVGDVAGLGADLYESYVSSIVAAVALGALVLVPAMGDDVSRILFPLFIAAGGLLAAIVGCICVLVGRANDPAKSLRNGLLLAALVSGIIALSLSFWLFEAYQLEAFLAVFFGILVGVGIGLITEYYTSDKFKHIQYVKKMSKTGTATNIIGGFATGLFSAWPIALLMGLGIAAAAFVGTASGNQMYFLALSAVGMLSTIGITVSIDSYGPVSDNAGGLVEMAGLGEDVRAVTDHLDAVGNTTAAIGKGFSIGSAAFTVVGLFATFVMRLNLLDNPYLLSHLTVYNPIVIASALIGAAIPYLFSAFTIKSVGKGANEMVEEVRRQFAETPGLLEGKPGVVPDYKRCVDISTKAALRELIMPGLLAVIAPLVTGILFGFVGLAGLLLGTFVSGIVLALFMGNVGGIWDNTKKSFSSHGQKGSSLYKSAVIGDTVGDPLKDTAGPAIDILIKLMTILSVVFIPVFATAGNGMGLLGQFFV